MVLVGRFVNFGIVLLGVALVAAACLLLSWAIAGRVRADRVEQVCAIAGDLRQSKQLTAALAAYHAAHARSGDACASDGLRAVAHQLEDRDRLVELARATRAAADRAGAEGGAARDAAIEAYMQGLAADPSSSGARRALRAALRDERAVRGPDGFCARAGRLLDLRLLEEARVAYALAFRPGEAQACVEGRKRLNEQRVIALASMREARAKAAAGRVAEARTAYLAALGADRSFAAAREGLNKLKLPKIPKHGTIVPGGWEGLAIAGAAIVGAAVSLALLALGVAFIIWFIWWSLSLLARRVPGSRPVLSFLRLSRIAEPHVRLAPIQPLDRDGELLVRLIWEQVEQGPTPATTPANQLPRKWRLEPENALDQVAGVGPDGPSLAVSSLSLVPPLAPVAAGIALLPRLHTPLGVDRHAAAALRRRQA